MVFKRTNKTKAVKSETVAVNKTHKNVSKKAGKYWIKRNDTNMNRGLIILFIFNVILYYMSHPGDKADTNLRPVVAEANAVTTATAVAAVDTSKKVVEPAATPAKPAATPKSGSAAGKSLNEKEIEDVLKSGRTNVALKKVASQSETLKGQEADLAVDGNRESAVSHTNGCNPWWQVDLGSEQDVKDVIIFNRIDGFRGRLSNFDVAVLKLVSGNWEVAAEFVHTGTADEKAGIRFEPSSKGQIVRVHMNGCEPLHMREVEVYGA